MITIRAPGVVFVSDQESVCSGLSETIVRFCALQRLLLREQSQRLRVSGNVVGCRGKISLHSDDWQVNPHQRICSSSWLGRTPNLLNFTQRITSTLKIKVKAAVANARVSQNLRGAEGAVLKAFEHLLKKTKFPYSLQRGKWTLNDFSEARKKRLQGSPTAFEFCYSKDSSLRRVNAEGYIDNFRLGLRNSDLANHEKFNHSKPRRNLSQIPFAGGYPARSLVEVQVVVAPNTLGLSPRS